MKIDLGLSTRKSDCRNFWKSDYRWTGPQLEVENVNNSLGGRHFPAVNCQPRNKVAILIPYRNRDRELRVLLHHLHPILQRQQLSYGIFVIEQVNCFQNLAFLISFISSNNQSRIPNICNKYFVYLLFQWCYQVKVLNYITIQPKNANITLYIKS